MHGVWHCYFLPSFADKPLSLPTIYRRPLTRFPRARIPLVLAKEFGQDQIIIVGLVACTKAPREEKGGAYGSKPRHIYGNANLVGSRADD